MHETESPAPANVVLTREDAHFLAVRLRRLCAHLHYALPKFADDDANLVNIAGTVIGALLTNLTHGVATTPAPGNAEWEKDSLASCREHSGDDLCATCGKIWNDHFGRCCDPNPSARRFTLAADVTGRCPHCDDTGEVHDLNGEQLTCHCPAGLTGLPLTEGDQRLLDLLGPKHPAMADLIALLIAARSPCGA